MTHLQDFLNSSIPQVAAMRGRGMTGDLFGVELECEGVRVDYCGNKPEIINDWAPHRDGSLRENHGSACEWVFNGPVKHKTAIDRVNKLFDYFDQKKAKLVCSNRTSTHVHFNMADKNAYQVVNMFILFTIIEDIMDRYCGEDRRGNLFCLSSRHAHQQVEWVQAACFREFSFAHFRENWRYCSLNMAALNKFGTVEFRAMRGLDKREDVLQWIDILNDFCQYACYTMKNPAALIEQISQKTPIGFLREIFTNNNFRALTTGLTEEEINASVYEGLRIVQMLSYRIGTEFDKVRLRGRDFWASFEGSDAPEVVKRDVDPAAFANGGNPAAKKPLRGAGLAQAAAAFGRPGANGPELDAIIERERERQRIVAAQHEQLMAQRAAQLMAQRAEQPRQVPRPVRVVKARAVPLQWDVEALPLVPRDADPNQF